MSASFMLCCACLKNLKETEVIDLNALLDMENNLSYSECFKICTTIKIENSENLCSTCILELEMSYNFLKKVIIAQPLLRKLRKNSKHNNLDKAYNEVQFEKVEFKKQNCHIDYDSDRKPQDEIAMEMVEEYLDDELDDFDNVASCSNVTESTVKQETHMDYNIHIAQDVATEMVQEHFEDANYDNITSQNEALIVAKQIKVENAESSELTVIEKIELDFEEDRATISPTICEKQQNLKQECQPSNKHKLRGAKAKKVVDPTMNPARFICEFCGHESLTRSLLASHRHRKHTLKRNQVRCEKCNKAFDKPKQLERHKQRPDCLHYPTFSCKYCDKKITGSANLEIHLRFHEKRYPYVCHLCGKSFMLTVHLKNHLRTKHEQQRYVCEQQNCGKLFQSQHAFKTHMYTHMPSLPYKCKHCGRMMANKSRLRFHIHRTHQKIPTTNELDEMLVAEIITIKAKLKTIADIN